MSNSLFVKTLSEQMLYALFNRHLTTCNMYRYATKLGLPNVLESQGQSLNLPSKLTVSLIFEKRKNVLEKFWCS